MPNSGKLPLLSGISKRLSKSLDQILDLPVNEETASESAGKEKLQRISRKRLSSAALQASERTHCGEDNEQFSKV